jgi:hypothetical protein
MYEQELLALINMQLLQMMISSGVNSITAIVTE